MPVAKAHWDDIIPVCNKGLFLQPQVTIITVMKMTMKIAITMILMMSMVISVR